MLAWTGIAPKILFCTELGVWPSCGQKHANLSWASDHCRNLPWTAHHLITLNLIAKSKLHAPVFCSNMFARSVWMWMLQLWLSIGFLWDQKRVWNIPNLSLLFFFGSLLETITICRTKSQLRKKQSHKATDQLKIFATPNSERPWFGTFRKPFRFGIGDHAQPWRANKLNFLQNAVASIWGVTQNLQQKLWTQNAFCTSSGLSTTTWNTF